MEPYMQDPLAKRTGQPLEQRDRITFAPPSHAQRSALAGALFGGTVNLKMLAMAVVANATIRAEVLANPSLPGGSTPICAPLGLSYVAGIQSHTTVWAPGTGPRPPKKWSGHGPRSLWVPEGWPGGRFRRIINPILPLLQCER
jgi:hypothetical protein